MAAEPSIKALPYRQPRFAPPLPVRPRRVAYSAESPSVPFPPALAPYLRRNDPGRHWRMVLAAIFDEMGKTEWPDERTRVAHELRRLVERRCDDDAAVPLVLSLVPPAACGWCGGAYLRESGRRQYCSDRCRRQGAIARLGPALARHAACVGCGEPLKERQRCYCSEACGRRVQNARARSGREGVK